MITAELEPVGGFVGEAFAVPISQAGTLLTILIFMFLCKTRCWLPAALAFYPLQGYLIPKMQQTSSVAPRAAYACAKIRGLSDRIAETIARLASRSGSMTAPSISQPKIAKPALAKFTSASVSKSTIEVL